MFRTTTSKTASAGPPLTRRAIRPFSLACTALLSALGTDGAIADLAWNQPTVVVYNTPHQTVHIDQQITSGTLTVIFRSKSPDFSTCICITFYIDVAGVC